MTSRLSRAEIIRDEGERIIDLVRHAGRGLAQAGHSRLLDHPGLGLLQFEVSLLEGRVCELNFMECSGQVTIRTAQLARALARP